jgi:hypothetical protein
MYWRLTDHVCRYCLGRMLTGVQPDGVVVSRCADCGVTREGDVVNVCCCGAALPTGRHAGLRCAPNPNQKASSPFEFGVVYVGDEP